MTLVIVSPVRVCLWRYLVKCSNNLGKKSLVDEVEIKLNENVNLVTVPTVTDLEDLVVVLNETQGLFANVIRPPHL